jgi:hypothetical protein
MARPIRLCVCDCMCECVLAYLSVCVSLCTDRVCLVCVCKRLHACMLCVCVCVCVTLLKGSDNAMKWRSSALTLPQTLNPKP